MLLNFREKIEALNETGLVVEKPWGYFRVIEHSENFKIKLIHINPHSKLSLQKHKHRTEHWTITQGEVKATIGNEEKLMKVDDREYIDVGVKHRLENETNQAVELVEVQLGSYLGEDDITRLADIYGRL